MKVRYDNESYNRILHQVKLRAKSFQFGGVAERKIYCQRGTYPFTGWSF
jgi:hypothetical protein